MVYVIMRLGGAVLESRRERFVQLLAHYDVSLQSVPIAGSWAR